MNTLPLFNSTSANIKRWLFVFTLAIITCCVWWLGDPDFRYQSPAKTLHLTEFTDDPELWRKRGEHGTVDISGKGITLSLDESSKLQVHADKFFDWDADAAAGATYLLVSGQLERLSSGSSTPELDERPAFSVRLRADGSRNGRGMLVRARGDLLVEHFVKLVKPTAGSDQLQLYWRLFTPGQWRLQDLTIRSVKISPAYYVAMLATLIPLGIGVLFIIIRLFRHLKPLQVMFLTGVAAVTITSTSLANSTMDHVRNVMLRNIPSDHLVSLWELNQYEVQKSGHVLVFMLITLVALWARKRLKVTYAQLVSSLFILALLTEALQRHSIGRTPRLEDIGLDLIGMCIGCVLFWLYLQVRRLAG